MLWSLLVVYLLASCSAECSPGSHGCTAEVPIVDEEATNMQISLLQKKKYAGKYDERMRVEEMETQKTSDEVRAATRSAEKTMVKEGYTPLKPDANLLVWDNIVDMPDGSVLHNGWLNVPLEHNPYATAAETPPHVCLRVRAQLATKKNNEGQAINGPIMMHCGGPGSGRSCLQSLKGRLLDIHKTSPDLENTYDMWSIDQRGVNINGWPIGGGPEEVETGKAEPGHGPLVPECPFKYPTGEAIKPFPVAYCNELPQLMETDPDRFQKIIASDDPGYNEVVPHIFALKGFGLIAPAYRNETWQRWHYRVVRAETTLCYNADRYKIKAPNGRVFNLMDYMGTMQLAFDIDIFREAIGANKMSFVGVSYGTRVASAYASIFPHKVHRMILDAIIKPDPDVRSFATISALGINQYWNGLANACEASLIDGSPQDEICPAASIIHGVSSKVYEMLSDASLEKNLWRSMEVLNLLQRLFSNATIAASTMACIEEAYSLVKQPGCYRPLPQSQSSLPKRESKAAQAPWPEDFVVSGMIHSVRACDINGRVNEEDYIEWWRTVKDLYPLGLGRGAIEMMSIGTWPGLPTPLPPLGAEKVAPLLIGNLHDPQTSYEGAQQMLKAFPAGSLMTWQGYGHGMSRPKNAMEIVGKYFKEESEGKIPEYTDEVALLLCSQVQHDYLKTGKLPENGHLCKSAGPPKLGPKAALQLEESLRNDIGSNYATPGVFAICMEGTVPSGDSCVPVKAHA